MPLCQQQGGSAEMVFGPAVPGCLPSCAPYDPEGSQTPAVGITPMNNYPVMWGPICGGVELRSADSSAR